MESNANIDVNNVNLTLDDLIVDDMILGLVGNELDHTSLNVTMDDVLYFDVTTDDINQLLTLGNAVHFQHTDMAFAAQNLSGDENQENNSAVTFQLSSGNQNESGLLVEQGNGAAAWDWLENEPGTSSSSEFIGELFDVTIDDNYQLLTPGNPIHFKHTDMAFDVQNFDDDENQEKNAAVTFQLCSGNQNESGPLVGQGNDAVPWEWLGHDTVAWDWLEYEPGTSASSDPIGEPNESAQNRDDCKKRRKREGSPVTNEVVQKPATKKKTKSKKTRRGKKRSHVSRV